MLDGGDIVLRDRIGRLASRYADGQARAALAQAITALILEESGGRIVRGALQIDVASRRVRLGAGTVELLPREFSLLLALARADGAVDIATLRAAVLGRAFDTGTNAIAVHVSRLRGKLGKDAVLTIPGAGYRLNSFAVPDQLQRRGCG